ncbi:MAG: protein kinase [Polyangiaceae bacterium]|nr:protein kinase [Polyangiaceae bacterium]
MDSGTVIADRFEIERRVSTGGMSAVLRARDRRLGGVVAIKVLFGRDAGEHRERLYREARILEKLSHPGIVRHVAHGETLDGQPFLAMEWIAGETLDKRLSRTGLTMDEAVRLVTRVAETLAVAHGKGIIHRDIKPSNLILRGGDLERPTIIDFGIARMGLGASSITNTGVMLGTLGYMSPEQARGIKDIDARADVFALGAVLFKCVTGEPAFPGDDEVAVLTKMLFDKPPRARDVRKDVPAPLDDLLARMLSRDIAQRPMDGGVAAAELAALGPMDSVVPYSVRETGMQGNRITHGEQRLVSVVAVTSHLGSDDDDTLRGRAWGGLKTLADQLRAASAPFGAQIEAPANGIIVATLPGRNDATDQAARAARCVLSMRAAAPQAQMVLVTGRAVFHEGVPAGDAVDRAIRMLHHLPAAMPASDGKFPVYVDEVTAGLLDERFVVVSDGAARLHLEGEQASPDASRMLLGKPTPCVGRERELVMLDSVFAEVVADDVARVVLVTAPAGVGKSRLRCEFLRALRHRGDPHEEWTSRGDPMRAGSPFGMLGQILRAAAGTQDGEAARVQAEKVRARVSRHVAPAESERVTRFLCELLGLSRPEDDDVQLRAARHDSILMGDQMRRAFEDWLLAECTEHPVLLVLEDLHWGDLPSVKFIDAALRALSNKPIMVLALARPEVFDLFPDLFKERGVQGLVLKELSKKASEKLVRQVLGETAHDDVVSQVVRAAGGNAFYLEELIRSVALSGSSRSTVGVTPNQSGWAMHPALESLLKPSLTPLPLALPATVLAMVQARFEALEPDARRVLRAASVFGQSFWRGGVIALLASEHEDALVGAWLDELCERELISRHDETKFRGEQEYVFRHALISETAYTTLTDRDRTLGHKLAAQWLERVGESEAVVLAEHLDRGGEPARAITFYRRAAAQALEGNDLAACLARADAGIHCGADGEVLGRLLLRKAEAHRWRAENALAKECAEHALGLLPRGERRWFLAAGEAVEASARLGEHGDLQHTVDQLRAVTTPERLTPPHLIALTRAACMLMEAGNYLSADELLRAIDGAYEAAREEREQDDDPLAAAHVYRTRAYRAQVAGDAATALSLYNIAIAKFEEAGDTRAACRQLVSAAAACIELGAYAEAERALDDALASSERMGLTGVIASARHHSAMLLARQGDTATALALANSAIAAFAAQGDRHMEAAARLYRAVFLARSKDLAEAEREAKAAIEGSGAYSPLGAYAYAVLGRIYLNGNQPNRAEAPAYEAIRLLDSLGGVEEGESYLRLVFAETRIALGDREGARDALATARVRILERTAMIHDATWKAFFLERVPENARTLELSRTFK